MIIYLSSFTQGVRNKIEAYMENRPPDKFNILESFYYVNNEERIKLSLKFANKFMLDSGAFSVKKGKEKVNIDKYCDFIIKYQNDIDFYINLDVKGGTKETIEEGIQNFYRMEDLGLSPIPVYHMNEDHETLARIADLSDYIGIGGSAGEATARDQIRRTYNFIFEKYPDHKIHGLGIGNLSNLFEFPFHSVDTHSWKDYARFGNIIIFHGKELHKFQLSNQRGVTIPYADRDYVAKLFEDLNLTLQEVVNDFTHRWYINALEMKKAEDFINDNHNHINKTQLRLDF